MNDTTIECGLVLSAKGVRLGWMERAVLGFGSCVWLSRVWGGFWLLPSWEWKWDKIADAMGAHLEPLVGLKAEAWTTTHDILQSQTAPLEGKLFAATTLKGKVSIF